MSDGDDCFLDEPELPIPMTADKRMTTVRFWGLCPSGGMHEDVPCRKCQARPRS